MRASILHFWFSSFQLHQTVKQFFCLISWFLPYKTYTVYTCCSTLESYNCVPSNWRKQRRSIHWSTSFTSLLIFGELNNFLNISLFISFWCSPLALKEESNSLQSWLNGEKCRKALIGYINVFDSLMHFQVYVKQAHYNEIPKWFLFLNLIH